ncbi:MAG: ATP-binding protein [Spirochaetota bacterium]
MPDKTYLPRLIDDKVTQYLAAFGAIAIDGPKWCGKTMTSLHHSRSSYFVGSPAGNFNNRSLAMMDPSLALAGETPHVIDEWQEVPALWDAVRHAVDQRGEKGQFILTGSSTPPHKGILHSGAGRIARLRMRTMSLYESGHSSGKVSLKNLFSGVLHPELTGEVILQELIEHIVRGGWPENVGLDFELAKLLPTQYIEAVVYDDIRKVDGTKRDLNKILLLLRSLARNESTTASNRTLQRDIKEIDDEDIDVNTVGEYLNIFERLFLIDNQKPFSPGLRSSVRVKQSVKRHFTDPSLACALMGATSESLLSDLETFELLFEAMCVRDLSIYAQAIDAKMFHYQDYSGREIDAVIEMPDGSWGAFEIKLGAHQLDTAAENLLTIKQKIVKDPKGKPPKILCVICGLSNAAYQRSDGVLVVPITALKA